MSPEEQLDALRQALDELDALLVDSMARRQSLVRRIGALKTRHNLPTRDFRRERIVFEAVREQARTAGLEPKLALEVFTALVEQSLTVQEGDRVASARRGAGRRALVIGGAGLMGTWFVHLLTEQGYAVDISDPALSHEDPRLVDWEATSLDYHRIVVATPLQATGDVLHQLSKRSTQAVILDIASVKSPVRQGLHACVSNGLAVASIHPMFGPDTRLLSGRHVIRISLGDERADEAVADLFTDTMARVVDMSLEQHDRAIAFVLGLSHALNISFGAALEYSGEQARQLATLSSTTFDAQCEVAGRVSAENPSLYYDIQHLNDHGMTALDALHDAVSSLRDAVRSQDASAFKALMDGSRRWFEHR